MFFIRTFIVFSRSRERESYIIDMPLIRTFIVLRVTFLTMCWNHNINSSITRSISWRHSIVFTMQCYLGKQTFRTQPKSEYRALQSSYNPPRPLFFLYFKVKVLNLSLNPNPNQHGSIP
jgi:hypothetical protein